MPILTCKRIKEAVDKYNSGQSAKDDLALIEALVAVQSLEASLGRFVAEVWVVANWGMIPYFPLGDRLSMAREIEACWPLLQTMRSRHARRWGTETKIMVGLVDDLANNTHLLPTPGTKRRQLSFLSKYLHFCINDGFPIWDSRARKALRNHNDKATWASYKEWLNQIRQKAANRRACLEQIRLPGESLVRTLDKALYTIGEKKKKKTDASSSKSA